MADGTKDFVEICPGNNLSVGKWVWEGDGKFADAANFTPGACGKFVFYIGIWNKNDKEAITVLPYAVTSKFPMRDTFPSDLTIKDIVVLGPPSVITYTLSANTNTLVIENPLADLRPDNQISRYNKNAEFQSFAGIAVTAELCK